MEMLDSRRLTGPNLLWEHAGAVIDVAFGDMEPRLVIGAWEREIRRLLDDVGWQDERMCVRCFEGGASLAISAPVDALYTATEINEVAWDAACDFLDAGQRRLQLRLASQLQDEVREEISPRLRRLMEAAKAHGVTVVLDTDEVSLGLGKHSRCWDLAELPEPEDVDFKLLSTIPVALVTGTNGKTTTVRMMASIGRAAGVTTGVSSTDWLAVGEDIIEKDDFAGPQGARTILRDSRCELAILETARGGLLRRGLAVEHADAALITNIAADHIGEFGVQNLDELADVKWIVTRALQAQDTLVLNADDPLLLARAGQTSAGIIWFSLDQSNPVLRAHREAGGTVCTLNRGRICLGRGGELMPVVTVRKVPVCFGGAARHNVANALGATALAHALGLSHQAIKDGLCAFKEEDNPGRANIYDINGISVLMDFAHNPHGLAAVIDMAAQLPAQRRLLIIGQAGDRGDGDIRDLAGATSSLAFDRVVIKRLDMFRRGRPARETAVILRKEFLSQGYKTAQLAEYQSELGAFQASLKWAQPGDLIVFLVHEDRDAAIALLTKLQTAATQGQIC
jgi:cyanophycin synthetase